MNPRASALLAVTAAMMAGPVAAAFPPAPAAHRAHPRRLTLDEATGAYQPSPEDSDRLAAAEAKRARRAARNLRRGAA